MGMVKNRVRQLRCKLARDAEHAEVITVLEDWLKQKADGTTQETPLITAVENKDFETVKKLLAEHPESVNEINEQGGTALIRVSAQNDLECVQLLLETGADAAYLSPNPVNSDHSRNGRAAIHRVVHHRCQDQEKSRKILRVLLDHGTPYDHEIAAWMGDLDTVIEKTGNNKKRKDEALIAAAQMGELTVIRWLLDHGVDPNTPRDIDIGGEFFHEEAAAVWEAAAQGHIEVVRELLTRGAKPNEVLYASGWPVTIADIHGHADVQELLFTHGHRLRLIGMKIRWRK